MELVFELLDKRQHGRTDSPTKTFGRAGGEIGRAKDCHWCIEDDKRHLSSHHAQVTYENGGFFLTDISSNGVRLASSGAQLRKGEPYRIEQGAVYRLGDIEVRARLIDSEPGMDVSLGMPGGNIIPDDAFLELDPITALDQEESRLHPMDELAAMAMPEPPARQRADYAQIDRESLIVPTLVPAVAPEPAPAPAPRERRDDAFWKRFGAALGVDMDNLDEQAREDLAVQAAGLLRHSIGGLQQSLRTRSELKNELRLSLTTPQGASRNPIKAPLEADQVLGELLKPRRGGQMSAEQAVSQAFRDLQAHQVAMLGASRHALRSTLEHFAPEQLVLQFERQGRRGLFGSRWKSYVRYHQALMGNEDWSERLLAKDFARTYEEQVRLIASLHHDPQG
ncbi:type VI secretion system-associated FHA domain protein TagH [Pseudomonas entomophila]|uniref:type VI secretion system-associated FHA domain protein TagH n=1 Tax=Pseudomonas entomophila TaxID=312306 RepID=UPI001F030514|nr:type VI secretion system-associated FHA domain protein TagH [Pseudomonas entomophila]MCG8295954.1 type VI secretion system-associated FHA domain protein TagH [Pseudomonas entomophila]